MPIGEFCTKNAVTARGGETVACPAIRMKEKNVGAIVVVDRYGVPTGIITDRDIAVKVVAQAKDPGSTPSTMP